MLRSILIATAVSIFAGPALAGTFTIETVSPVPAGETIIAEKAVWSCQDTLCVADLKRKTVTVRSCKKVAKEVGEIKSFKNEKASLTDEEIASCNKSAKR